MKASIKEREIVHAYLDNELSTPERDAFAARIITEPTLGVTIAAEQRWRTALRTRLTRTRAPATLHANVQRALAPPPARPQHWWRWWLTPQPIRPLTGLAYTLLWVLVLGGVLWSSTRPTIVATRALDALFQRHELYFENRPALDVTGTAAQIRAWFDQKVAYDVNAPPLGGGWQLTGARLDELEQQQTAHILYIRGNGQRISLSIFPRQTFAAPVGTKIRFAGQEFWLRDNDVHLAIFWQSAQRDYVLMGDIEVPTTELLELAVEARTRLP